MQPDLSDFPAGSGKSGKGLSVIRRHVRVQQSSKMLPSVRSEPWGEGCSSGNIPQETALKERKMPGHGSRNAQAFPMPPAPSFSGVPFQLLMAHGRRPVLPKVDQREAASKMMCCRKQAGNVHRLPIPTLRLVCKTLGNWNGNAACDHVLPHGRMPNTFKARVLWPFCRPV